MTTAATNAPATGPRAWFAKSEAWLDDKGKGAWIAAMVLGFIFFWPVGLALLFYMIWSKRMFNGSCRTSRRHARHHYHSARHNTSGNSAFDAYKEETLRRLEQEQEQFEAFLQRLREAKDKTEFDQFMEERAFDAAAEADADADDSDDDTPKGDKKTA